MNISSLNFGAPAAERDIDMGLAQYFIESEAYQRVVQRKKTVILGNRGSGKSAIFKIFAKRQKQAGSCVLELKPEDYSYEMLASTLRKEAEGSWAKQGAFTSAWKYLIYVLIMKEMTSTGQRFKTGSAEKIYSYLRDKHKGFQENPISLLISYLKRIEGLKIAQFEASVKTRELDSLYKLEEIEPLLPSVINLAGKRKVLVFVDELDRGWDASEDAKAFVAGLFQACVSINQLTTNITVYISLRRELYDSIPALYDDAQKYRDIIETISWDEPSLLALVAKRIQHTVPALVGTDDTDAWNMIFAETLQYRQAKSFNYMIDRTLYRPREIVQFCTDALDDARKNATFPIDYPVIASAEMRYGEARTKDIAAEYKFQYPGLLSIFEVFRGQSYTFDRKDLETICLKITIGEVGIDDAAKPWVNNQEPEMLIYVLWQVGFLRAQAVGGIKALRRSGSSYLGPHQVSNLNLRNITRFHVHPMFRAFLGLKEAKGVPAPE